MASNNSIPIRRNLNISFNSANVNGLTKEEKLEECIVSMKKTNSFMAFIQETQRTNFEQFSLKGYLFILSEAIINNGHGKNSAGVGFVLSPQAQLAWNLHGLMLTKYYIRTWDQE